VTRILAKELFAGEGVATVRLRRKMRRVILFRGEDGYWVIECPSLPGCISQGKTRKEAVANIKEAIRGYVRPLEDDHLQASP
jgi:predicted RNase H-like HicB family nuclease